MKIVLALSALVIAMNSFAGDLPDPKLTPGAINPNVTQENIYDTICKSGWTKTIRPSSYYVTKLKLKQMAEQNLPGNPKDYEEDHLISLELGGNPTNPKNLWPELWYSDSGWGAHKKDVIETYLKRKVCSKKGDQIALADAQNWIATDWIATYKQFIKPKKK